MRADVGEAQRLRLVDQHAEHAPAVGQIPDRAVRLLVDALGDELLEQLPPLVEDADRGVASAGQLLGDLEQPVEHDVGLELLEEGPPDVEEPPEPGFVHGLDDTGRQRRLTSLSEPERVIVRPE